MYRFTSSQVFGRIHDMMKEIAKELASVFHLMGEDLSCGFQVSAEPLNAAENFDGVRIINQLNQIHIGVCYYLSRPCMSI
jgi:hypothetical protein